MPLEATTHRTIIFSCTHESGTQAVLTCLIMLSMCCQVWTNPVVGLSLRDNRLLSFIFPIKMETVSFKRMVEYRKLTCQNKCLLTWECRSSKNGKNNCFKHAKENTRKYYTFKSILLKKRASDAEDEKCQRIVWWNKRLMWYAGGNLRQMRWNL